MMITLPMLRSSALFFIAFAIPCWIGTAAAADRTITSPILHVDKDKGAIMVSGDAGVVTVDVTKAAKPHLNELPASGMISLVVEVRPGKHPLLKAWKVTRGESSCKNFNGQSCK